MPRADLTMLLRTHQLADGACLLLSTAYRLPAFLLLPLTGLLSFVYRLPALLAGAALAVAHTCVGDGIASPYGVWVCLCYTP